MLGLFSESNTEEHIAYKTLSKAEFDWIRNYSFTGFPARIFEERAFILYLDPVHLEKMLAEPNNWNRKQKEIYVVKFLIRKDLVQNYIKRNCIIMSETRASTTELYLVNCAIVGMIELHKIARPFN